MVIVVLHFWHCNCFKINFKTQYSLQYNDWLKQWILQFKKPWTYPSSSFESSSWSLSFSCLFFLQYLKVQSSHEADYLTRILEGLGKSLELLMVLGIPSSLVASSLFYYNWYSSLGTDEWWFYLALVWLWINWSSLEHSISSSYLFCNKHNIFLKSFYPDYCLFHFLLKY